MIHFNVHLEILVQSVSFQEPYHSFGIHISAITIDGNACFGPGENTGILFQHNSLFPWMTVKKNITFGIRQSHPDMKKAERELRSTVGDLQTQLTTLKSAAEAAQAAADAAKTAAAEEKLQQIHSATGFYKQIMIAAL